MHIKIGDKVMQSEINSTLETLGWDLQDSRAARKELAKLLAVATLISITLVGIIGIAVGISPNLQAALLIISVPLFATSIAASEAVRVAKIETTTMLLQLGILALIETNGASNAPYQENGSEKLEEPQ